MLNNLLSLEALLSIGISLLCFVPAIVMHEVAHGLVAYKLGDPTASQSGRLSLNPLKHIDLVGTLILPLMLMIAGGPVFGYAKPVPYNPNHFKDPRRDDVLVGLAGPFANLCMAALAGIVAWVLYPLAQGNLENLIFRYFYLSFLPNFALINLFFMFFNLLPIPPLDGSSIFAVLLPRRYMSQYYQVQRYAMPIFLIVIFALPYLLHVDLVGMYLRATAMPLANMFFPFRIA